MNFENCCYTLTATCCPHNLKMHFMTNTPVIWKPAHSSMQAHLELGEKIGRLCIMCCCCVHGPQRWDYFFSNTENDHILNCMQPVSCSKEYICIYLPNGDIGIFVLNIEIDDEWWDANDSYVLRVAAIDNDNNPDEFTLALLFETFYRQIRLRTAWGKMYFRCFRKAFHPMKSQGKRLIAQWQDILLSNVLVLNSFDETYN